MIYFKLNIDHGCDLKWISMNIKFSIALFIIKGKNHLNLINIVKYFTSIIIYHQKLIFKDVSSYLWFVSKSWKERNFHFIHMKRYVTFFTYCRHMHLLMKLYWICYVSLDWCCLEWWKIMKNDQRKNFSKLSIWNG